MRTKITAIAATVLGLGLALQGAMALVDSPTAQRRNAKGLSRVQVVTDATQQTTTSTTWVDVPGATATFTHPKKQKTLILATFSGPSMCTGGAGECKVKILINGLEAEPATTDGSIFDDAIAGHDDGWESHSLQRTRGTLRDKTYTIQVQWRVTDAATTFALDDWTLTAERVRTSA